MSKVPIIEVNIDDNSSKKDEKVENPSSKNTTKEEIKESLSISEAEIKKKRIRVHTFPSLSINLNKGYAVRLSMA